MPTLLPIRRMLICPNCDGADGFTEKDLIATCNKCKKEFDLHDLFIKVLTEKHDSDLWLYPFSILSEFNLVPIHEGVLPAKDFTYTPLHFFQLDLTKCGVPANARILYVNISPEGEEADPILIFGHVVGLQLRSIAEIPLILSFITTVQHASTEAAKLDFSKKQGANLLVRWVEKLDNQIVADHLIRCAEAYWKQDTKQMIYNGFSSFELTLGNVLELFWLKVKGIDEKGYEGLFGRDSIHRKMTVHFPVLCQDLGVVLSADIQQKWKQTEELRQQRNEIVHSGKVKAGKPPDQKRLFAGLCWSLLFLQSLTEKINAFK